MSGFNDSDLLAFGAVLVAALGVVVLGAVLGARGTGTAEGRSRGVYAGLAGLFALAPGWFSAPFYLYVSAVLLAGVLVAWPRPRRRDRASLPLALVPALFMCWTLGPGRLFALQVVFMVIAGSVPFSAWVAETWAGERATPGGSRAAGLTFAVAAFVLCLAALRVFPSGVPWRAGDSVPAALLVALAGAGVVVLSPRGRGTLVLVVLLAAVLVYYDEHPGARWLMAASGLVGVGFAFAARRMRLLSPDGAVAGGLVAFLVVGMGGWAWAVPSFVFFLSSSLWSELGRRRKAGAEALSEKGSVRDAGQVYANGGIGCVLLLAYAVAPWQGFYWGFLGAFAAAAADTWATELGTLGRARPRLITTGRAVPKGTSGAVSGAGTLAAVLGALAVAGASGLVPGGLEGASAVARVALAGFAGALADSVLGATVQARYRDPRTGADTERPDSVGAPHRLVRGWAWLDNDRVNLVCTGVGAALALLFAV